MDDKVYHKIFPVTFLFCKSESFPSKSHKTSNRNLLQLSQEALYLELELPLAPIRSHKEVYNNYSCMYIASCI